jgi:hypothetical protein
MAVRGRWPLMPRTSWVVVAPNGTTPDDPSSDGATRPACPSARGQVSRLTSMRPAQSNATPTARGETADTEGCRLRLNK